MAFHIPQGWDNFYHIALQKYETLIDKKIITHIDKITLRGWSQQFNTSEERYLAAHLLDAFFYRTDKMNDAVYEHIFNIKLPFELNRFGLFEYESIETFKKALSIERNAKLKICSIDTRVGTGKSSSSYVRGFKKKNSIQQSYLINASQLSNLTSQIDIVIFIDDMVGTGKQFCKFYDDFEVDKLSDFKLLYIPLIAHSSGVKQIQEHCGNVLISPVEIVNQEHNFFLENEQNLWLKDKANLASDAEDFYRALLKKKNIFNKEYYLGKGKFGLTVFFADSTPNNSLNIFSTDANGWIPLVAR